MLKLRFLFNNECLAFMILENWRHDPDSYEMFKYFRISSNAVYPFKADGRVCFLRFAPVSEKISGNVYGELEFIEYLRRSGYNAPKIIASKKGNLLETVQTPWGEYCATVFEGVPGRQLEGLPQEDEVIFGYGSSLGELHKISAAYRPKLKRRWNWQDALNWSRGVLNGCTEEEAAIREIDLLQSFFSALPTDDKNFGLVHYDFETDNVFYDKEKKEFHAIDFDDAMYHWYALDLEQALESATEDMEPSAADHYRELFLKGYRSRYGISDEMLSLMTVFRRFANIYGYVRIIRAVRETWENEPEWMADLRKHLEMLRLRRAANFGRPMEF